MDKKWEKKVLNEKEETKRVISFYLYVTSFTIVFLYDISLGFWLL